MQCSNCQTEVEESDRFCPNCGAQFDPDATVSDEMTTTSTTSEEFTFSATARIRQAVVVYALLSVITIPYGIITVFSRFPGLQNESISAVFNIPAQIAIIVLWLGIAYGFVRKARWTRMAAVGVFGIVGLVKLLSILRITAASYYLDVTSVLLELIPLPAMVYQVIAPIHALAAIGVGVLLAVQDELWESGSGPSSSQQSTGLPSIGPGKISFPTFAVVLGYGIAGICMSIIPIFLTEDFPLLTPNLGMQVAGMMAMTGGVIVIGAAAFRTMDKQGKRARSVGILGTLLFLLGTLLLFIV